MINLSHAKKAQALASDVEYRTKLHDYTVLPDDIKVQQAKKAYSLQSEVRNRRKEWVLVIQMVEGIQRAIFPVSDT